MSKITFEKDFTRHPLHYFLLLCVLLIGLWGIFWFNYQPITQLIIMGFMGAAYVVWGTFHHSSHNDLHIKIVVEYLLAALLAILLFGALVLKP